MAWSDIGYVPGAGSSDDKVKAEYLKIEGTIQVRILDDEPVTNWTHWIPQLGGGKGGSVDCIGKGCPVCKIIAADKKEKITPKYSSSKKHMINVLDRKDGKVKILNAGETVFEQLKNIMMSMGDLKSFDVKISRTGTGKGTKYSVLPTYPPTPLTDAEKALPKFDLTTVKKPLTEEQIVELMNGKSYKDIFSAQDTETVPDEESGVDFTQE